MKTRLYAFTAVAALGMVSVPSWAQPPLFTTAMPKEEFAARRARVMEQIGDGIVVMQGATETAAYEKFRQSVQFYYLTGIETPRAILTIDGKSKTTTLYLNPTNERMERSEGPLLGPGEAAQSLTGIEHVVPRDEFLKRAPSLAGRTVYTTFRGETGEAGTPDPNSDVLPVSVNSPMGEALMKARVGDTVKVRAPRNQTSAGYVTT